MDDTTEIKLYNSKGKYIRLALLCSIFVGIGAIMVTHDSAEKSLWIGWLNIIFFGFGIVVAIKQLMNKEPRITISDSGITDHTLKIGQFDWSDILESNLMQIQAERFISLVLRDEKKYLDRLSGTGKKFASANNMIGFQKLNINLSGVECNTGEVLNIVRQRSGYARNKQL